MRKLDPKPQDAPTSLLTDNKDIEIHEADNSEEKWSFKGKKVTNETLAFFNGNRSASNAWMNLCALKDYDGNIYEESPVAMFNRITQEIVNVESKYCNSMRHDHVSDLLKDFKYIVLGTSEMRNIGNCFQLSPISDSFAIGNPDNTDSYGGILKIDEEQVQILKRRAGVAHDLSAIRPKGAPVLNSALTSTGVVPFIHRYSNTFNAFAKDAWCGRLGLSIDIQHPDVSDLVIEKFEKQKLSQVKTSFRIKSNVIKHLKTDNNHSYASFSKESDALKAPVNIIWDKLMNAVWNGHEPGILFWDNIRKESISDCYAKYGFNSVTTDVNHGKAISKYETAPNIFINIFSHIKEPFTKQAVIDYELFTKNIFAAVKICDDLIDLNTEKIEKIIEKIRNDPEQDSIKHTELSIWSNIKKKNLAGRRISIGIIGEADALAALGLNYNNSATLNFINEMHKHLMLEAFRSSVILAEERGPFPIYNYHLEKDNPVIQQIKKIDPELHELMQSRGRRNIQIINISSSGSAALLSGTSPGQSPLYSTYYMRKTEVDQKELLKKACQVHNDEAIEFHPSVKLWLESQNINPDNLIKKGKENIDKVMDNSVFNGLILKSLDWKKQLEIIVASQKWTDQNVNGSIIVPESTTRDTISEIYLTAFEKGCKNITIYRENARNGFQSKKSTPKHRTISQRPKILKADVIRFKNNTENWIAFVGLNEGNPYEIFTGLDDIEHFPIPQSIEKGQIIKWQDNTGTNNYDFEYIDNQGYSNKIGGLHRMFNPTYWNYAKLISGVLRHNMPIVNVVQLVSSLSLDFDNIHTWAKGVKRALEGYIENDTEIEGKCENCGSSNIAYQEGCPKCKDCGFGQC